MAPETQPLGRQGRADFPFSSGGASPPGRALRHERKTGWEIARRSEPNRQVSLGCNASPRHQKQPFLGQVCTKMCTNSQREIPA